MNVTLLVVRRFMLSFSATFTSPSPELADIAAFVQMQRIVSIIPPPSRCEPLVLNVTLPSDGAVHAHQRVLADADTPPEVKPEPPEIGATMFQFRRISPVGAEMASSP